MRAAVCSRYGPPEVLQLREVARPVPRRGDMLVRIHATAVSSSDTYIRSGAPFARFAYRMLIRLVLGFSGPRRSILGAALSGEVRETGRSVTRFGVGDRVVAF